MQELTNGTQVTVNGNSQAVIRSFDKELGMYEVRLMDGCRFVGDIIVSADRVVTPEAA